MHRIATIAGDLEFERELHAHIRIQGRDENAWIGHIVVLPREVILALKCQIITHGDKGRGHGHGLLHIANL